MAAPSCGEGVVARVLWRGCCGEGVVAWVLWRGCCGIVPVAIGDDQDIDWSL